jgi:hypothetical protein
VGVVHGVHCRPGAGETDRRRSKVTARAGLMSQAGQAAGARQRR